MRLDEKWIRAHLPENVADQPLDCFAGAYLDGLTVMHEGERGGDDVVVYRAKDKEDLRWWQLEQVCLYIHEPDPPARKIWRFYRDHAEDGKWLYTERKTMTITPLKTRGFMVLNVSCGCCVTVSRPTDGKEKCRSILL